MRQKLVEERLLREEVEEDQQLEEEHTQSKRAKPMVDYTEQESANDVQAQIDIHLGTEEEEEYVPNSNIEVEED